MQLNSDKIRRTTLLILVLGSAAWLASHRGELDVGVLESWLSAAGHYGPLVYMMIAATATVLLVPASFFLL